MIIVTTYVAEDGTSFLTPEECTEYEIKQSFDNVHVKLWDKNYNPLPKTFYNLKCAVYFRVSTAKDFAAYRDWLIYNNVESNGLDSDDWDALWEWDYDNDYWKNVTEQYTTLREKIETMTID